jgi:hypothetical protein
MTFLSPLFFLALGALAIPVLVHLVQRERKRVVEFPSLMFVQRIPYQSVRRRRLRHWFLLLMRAAALAMIVAAFARPLLLARAAAAVALTGGSREVVILLDQSASMGYGDRWQRARAAAERAIGEVGVNDKATLVFFGRNAEENIRATSDRGRLQAALSSATLTAGGTRFGPALKLAESILAQSTLPRREAILISDFQKTGWSAAEDVHFTEGVRLTPVSVAEGPTSNISVPSAAFARASFSGQERITVTAGVSNRSGAAASGIPVSLELDGQTLETKNVDVGAGAAASVTFSQFTLTGPLMHGVVRAGTDALAADNAFHFVLRPSQAVSVLVVDSGDRVASFYLSRALSIGTTPAFRAEVTPAARVTPAMLERAAVVVLNNAAVPPGLAGGALRRFVERGGGLLVVFGDKSTWPSTEAELLPGTLGGTTDRTGDRGATVGYRDFSHPVFEIFKPARSGDFSAPRFYRYRVLQPAPADRVIARFDDGAVAAAERRIGTGRVIAWTSTMDDSWTDLVVKPVFLPLVQQMLRYLAQYEQTPAWLTVGQVVDVSAMLKARADRVVVTPSDERINLRSTEPGVVELNEQGVYEIRTGNGQGRPERIAVNLDPTESDLAPMDPSELVAAVTGRATQPGDLAPTVPVEVTPEEAERRQNIWWFLLFGGLLLLAAESAVANHLSRKERFL